MEMIPFIPPSQRRIAMLAAQADGAAVLICGSSGTGKSQIAKWIHTNSPRSGSPFILADRKKALSDQIREAQGGTLMIAEIGEWPLGEQKTLLHFLNTKSVPHPTLESTPMLVNARIMATSSQQLEGRAQGGLFNAELLKKLNVFRLEMPDLSRRADEFEDISYGIIQEITRELHKEHLKTASPQVFEKLRGYHWPGNVRELRNVLRIAVLSAKGDALEVGDLPLDFDRERADFRATREQFEKLYILELLKTFDWELDKTCQASRIPKVTLLSKIQKYGLEKRGGEVSGPTV